MVNTAVAMLVRTRQRKGNGITQQMPSLSDERTSPDGRTEPLAATISRDDLARRLGTEPSDETHLTETTEAVAVALQRMPAELRDLCRRLMGGTVTSVARDPGMSRRQVRNRLQNARPYLDQAGEEFLRPLAKKRTGRLLRAYIANRRPPWEQLRSDHQPLLIVHNRLFFRIERLTDPPSPQSHDVKA